MSVSAATGPVSQVDPYRGPIHFMVGHIAFALAILAAAFTTIPKSDSQLMPPLAAMIGGIIIWMSISALLGSICALILHLLRSAHRRAARQDANTLAIVILGFLPIVPGIVAVFYAVRGGAALLNAKSTLPAICDLPSLVF